MSFFFFSASFLIDDLLTIEIVEHFSATDNSSKQSNQFHSIEKTEENSTPQILKRLPSKPIPKVNEQAPSIEISSDEEEGDVVKAPVNKHVSSNHRNSGQLAQSKYYGSKGALPSPLGSAQSFDLQVRKDFLLNFLVIFTFERPGIFVLSFLPHF